MKAKFAKIVLASAVAASLAVAGLVLSQGCATTSMRPDSQHYYPPTTRKMVATGYCNCGKCCDWEYSWGRPVVSTGRNKGRRKKVGITASGTRAKMGTIAADTTEYPFGTIIYIPGYGYGRVEDRGGGIKGEHIDLWFRRHKAALQWGRKNTEVKVWLPKK